MNLWLLSVSMSELPYKMKTKYLDKLKSCNVSFYVQTRADAVHINANTYIVINWITDLTRTRKSGEKQL